MTGITAGALAIGVALLRLPDEYADRARLFVTRHLEDVEEIARGGFQRALDEVETTLMQVLTKLSVNDDTSENWFERGVERPRDV